MNTLEEILRRADYRRMQETIQDTSPEYPGSAVLTTYVLGLREQNNGPLSRGQEQALQNYISNQAQAILRTTLRNKTTQHRLSLQATYAAAFRAGYRARKILHTENSQRAYAKGYAAGKEQEPHSGPDLRCAAEHTEQIQGVPTRVHEKEPTE